MRHMISPLDLEWDELLVYHQLYLRSEFTTGITKYTDRQIEDSLRKAKVGRTRIKTILKKFIEDGLFVGISEGIKGKNPKPAIGRLVKMKEISQTLIEPNMNLKQTLEDIDITKVDAITKPNTNLKQTLIDPLIKETKKKEKDINSASSEALWKLYPNKKNKARAMKEIPKLISKYGYEQMENCIYRYIEYVGNERKNGFTTLKYQSGSTFFNGTYVDYLDENFEEQQSQEQLKEKCEPLEIELKLEI